MATFCKPYRLETTFEPIFAELALYDVKERKKVNMCILLYFLLGHVYIQPLACFLIGYFNYKVSD